MDGVFHVFCILLVFGVLLGFGLVCLGMCMASKEEHAIRGLAPDATFDSDGESYADVLPSEDYEPEVR